MKSYIIPRHVLRWIVMAFVLWAVGYESAWTVALAIGLTLLCLEALNWAVIDLYSRVWTLQGQVDALVVFRDRRDERGERQ